MAETKRPGVGILNASLALAVFAVLATQLGGLVPETGVATIMPNEFFNVYDKTGPGYSNYKP